MQYMQERYNLGSIKGNGDYTILCIGESTTAMSHKDSYPDLLEKTLNQRNLGKHFRVINKGVWATNTSAILSRIEGYIEEYRPDMVIAMMGINDMGHRLIKKEDINNLTFMHSIKELRVYKFSLFVKSQIIALIKSYGPRQNINVETAEDIYDIQVKRFKQALSHEPNNDQLYLAYGKFLWNAGQSEQALPLFKKAIDLNHENIGSFVNLVQSSTNPQVILNNIHDILRNSDDLNNDERDKIIEIVYYHLSYEMPSQAEELLTEVSSLNPDNEEAYLWLGVHYCRQSQFDKAEDMFLIAKNMNPGNDEIYVEWGQCYWKQGRYDEGDQLFNQAILLDKGSISGYIEILDCCRNDSELARVENILKNAIDINNDDIKSYGHLASVYYKHGKVQQAEKYLSMAEDIRLKYSNTIILRNFRKLKQILIERNIQPVFMQYPMRSVKRLKNMFYNKEVIIFIDNEDMFKSAVKENGFDAIFRDNFAGDFGHCTTAGNRLIAENIAEVIINEVFSR